MKRCGEVRSTKRGSEICALCILRRRRDAEVRANRRNKVSDKAIESMRGRSDGCAMMVLL
jgi:hypothetical protein